MSTATLKSNQHGLNEDASGVSGNIAWVVDGESLSALDPSVAADYAHSISDRLREMVENDPAVDLSQLVRAATQVEDYPDCFASLAIARRDNHSLEYAVVGHAAVVFPVLDDVKLIQDTRGDDVDTGRQNQPGGYWVIAPGNEDVADNAVYGQETADGPVVVASDGAANALNMFDLHYTAGEMGNVGQAVESAWNAIEGTDDVTVAVV